MNKNKKVYVSLPIAIAENSVYKRYLEALDEISKIDELKYYEICSPININDFNENGIKESRNHKYSWYIGQDIERLLECDAIYMSHGWVSSKGCNAELAVAKIYEIPVYYADALDNFKY